MDEDKKRPEDINMLLDIDKFSGEHSGRIAPMVIFLLVAGIPPLLVVYFLVGKFNLFYLIPLYIPYVLKMAAITLGQESKRLEEFKRKIYDQYSSALDLLNIKTIHDDGCVEYINGTVAYLVIATNGNLTDELSRAQIIRRFFIQLNEGFTVDVHVHNVIASDELSSRYDGVKLFKDGDVEKDFINLIDHNRNLISNKSLITEVIYIVKARKSDYKKLKENVASSTASEDAKVFRGLDIASKDKVDSVLSRDIDAYVDFMEMQRRKYRTGKYYGSSVIGYDVVDEDKTEEDISIERGFMIHE